MHSTSWRSVLPMQSGESTANQQEGGGESEEEAVATWRKLTTRDLNSPLQPPCFDIRPIPFHAMPQADEGCMVLGFSGARRYHHATRFPSSPNPHNQHTTPYRYCSVLFDADTVGVTCITTLPTTLSSSEDILAAISTMSRVQSAHPKLLATVELQLQQQL